MHKGLENSMYKYNQKSTPMVKEGVYRAVNPLYITSGPFLGGN
jgi:hypothetical protein